MMLYFRNKLLSTKRERQQKEHDSKGRLAAKFPWNALQGMVPTWLNGCKSTIWTCDSKSCVVHVLPRDRLYTVISQPPNTVLGSIPVCVKDDMCILLHYYALVDQRGACRATNFGVNCFSLASTVFLRKFSIMVKC